MLPINAIHPLYPLVKYAKTGIAPPEMKAAETAIGKQRLFVVVIKLLQLIGHEELPYPLNPEWTWCKELPAILAEFPELKHVLEIGSDNTLLYVSTLDSSCQRELTTWLNTIYCPPVDT